MPSISQREVTHTLVPPRLAEVVDDLDEGQRALHERVVERTDRLDPDSDRRGCSPVMISASRRGRRRCLELARGRVELPPDGTTSVQVERRGRIERDQLLRAAARDRPDFADCGSPAQPHSTRTALKTKFVSSSGLATLTIVRKPQFVCEDTVGRIRVRLFGREAADVEQLRRRAAEVCEDDVYRCNGIGRVTRRSRIAVFPVT